MIRLMGGLGNQMFQYAFGRSLSLQYKTELVLDGSLLLDKSSDHHVTTHRDFDLDIFPNLKFRAAKESEVFLFNGDPKASVFNKITRRISLLFNPKKLIVQQANQIKTEYLNIEGDTCLAGRWQSYKFFENDFDQIKKDFILEKPSILNIDLLLEKIESQNSVCLHVRRGDLVTSPVYNKIIGALDFAYYKSAIEKMNALVPDPLYCIFSDDIEWCKQNMNLAASALFIDKSFSGTKAEGHLFLMSKCKHFIISNSTFAWWGAFLSGNTSKKIIYPKNWYKETSLVNPEMCPPEWMAN
ncbi:MAG: alpha-1,2-fucosyltransferase [Bacteroidetes bacterium]|nr:alpha-1,2-fucosyltransferase [Bacteroidota bacterium]